MGNQLRIAIVGFAAVALSFAQAGETPSAGSRALLEQALTADDPAALVGESVADAAVIRELAAGLPELRKKQGPAKAAAFAARLIDAARRSHDNALLADLLNQQSALLDLAGQFADAIKHSEEAALLYEQVGRPGAAAFARNDIASRLEEQGKLAEAAEQYRRSREEGWPHWTPAERVQSLLREGIVARVRGRPQEALRLCEEALGIARSSSDNASTARALNNLSLLNTNIGSYRDAIKFAKAGLELRRADDHQGRAISLTNLGLIYEAQGDKGEALRTYQAAAAEAALTKEPKGLAITAMNVGTQLRKLGKYSDARAQLEQALRISGEINFARLHAGALRELGLTLIALDHAKEGQAMLTSALTEAEKIGSRADFAETQLAIALHTAGDAKAAAQAAFDSAQAAQQPEFEWAALTILGDAQRRNGDVSAAIARYTDAVRVIERIRRNVAGGEVQRQTFFEDKLQPYHALVELYLEQGKPKEAFRWIQQTKARVLLDTLDLEQRQLASGLSREEMEELDALRQKVAEADAAKDVARAAAARAELDRTASGRAAPERLAPVADADELAHRLLDEDTALIEYLVLPSRTLACLLTIEHGEPKLEIAPIETGADEAQHDVEQLRGDLAHRSLGYDAKARALWKRFLQPFSSRLAARHHLIIAPSGWLWQLPFQALRDDAGHFAIDRWAITYAPSASSLAQMTALTKTARRKGALVMSDPTRDERDAQFAKLPGADRIAAELPAIYGETSTTVLAGPEATEHAFKARSGTVGVLHCAVHGVFDSVAPLDSYLRLAAGDGDDGFLKASEIMNLKLNASLAVLAACETARGGTDTGEGVIGMTWAFFLAGCPTVVASEWKVDSASTSDFALSFHRRRAAGDATAVALQRAAIELRKNREYQHPFYWAPFIAIGAARTADSR